MCPRPDNTAWKWETALDDALDSALNAHDPKPITRERLGKISREGGQEILTDTAGSIAQKNEERIKFNLVFGQIIGLLELKKPDGTEKWKDWDWQKALTNFNPNGPNAREELDKIKKAGIEEMMKIDTSTVFDKKIGEVLNGMLLKAVGEELVKVLSNSDKEASTQRVALSRKQRQRGPLMQPPPLPQKPEGSLPRVPLEDLAMLKQIVIDFQQKVNGIDIRKAYKESPLLGRFKLPHYKRDSQIKNLQTALKGFSESIGKENLLPAEAHSAIDQLKEKITKIKSSVHGKDKELIKTSRLANIIAGLEDQIKTFEGNVAKISKPKGPQ